MHLRKLSFFVLLIPCAGLIFSCAPNLAFQGVLGIDAEPPVFLACRAVSNSRVEFTFSEAVKAVYVRFDPAIECSTVSEGSNAG